MAGRRAAKSYRRRLLRRALRGWRDGIALARLKLQSHVHLGHYREAHVLRLAWSLWQVSVNRKRIVAMAREKTKRKVIRASIQGWRAIARRRTEVLCKVCDIN